MMTYVIYGFVLGYIIPYMARRFAKFSPASPSESIWRLIVPTKKVRCVKCYQNKKYKELCFAYVGRSFLYGLLCAFLFVQGVKHFDNFAIHADLAFVWALLLLAEIDYKTYLLPDVVTVPLLIGGFIVAAFFGGAAESSLAAAVGYILPVFAGLLIAWKHPDAFGGGDVKLLAAIGAWLGIVPVIGTMLISCLLFGLFALIRHRREGAFGPAICSAAIIVAFYFF